MDKGLPLAKLIGTKAAAYRPGQAHAKPNPTLAALPGSHGDSLWIEGLTREWPLSAHSRHPHLEKVISTDFRQPSDGIVSVVDQRRLKVWQALSELFLDTEIDNATFAYVAKAIIESEYSPGDIQTILWGEVFPALESNLRSVAGEWVGWTDDWLLKHLTVCERPLLQAAAGCVAAEIRRCCGEKFITECRSEQHFVRLVPLRPFRVVGRDLAGQRHGPSLGRLKRSDMLHGRRLPPIKRNRVSSGLALPDQIARPD